MPKAVTIVAPTSPAARRNPLRDAAQAALQTDLHTDAQALRAYALSLSCPSDGFGSTLEALGACQAAEMLIRFIETGNPLPPEPHGLGRPN
jgi:hypothetical protein